MIRLVLLLTLAVVLAGCAGQRPQEHGLTLNDALAQLDALPTPEGVSDSNFAGLKSALADSLLASGKTRFVSAVPTGNSALVDDLAISQAGAEVSLQWTYQNKGDYDQNSEANISDLTPLGANLNKNTASPDWNTKAVAADGDENGEVNIADITPIGANFLGKVDGYVVEASTDPANEGSWAQVDQVSFDEAILEGDSPLKRFNVQLPAPSVPTSFRVRAVSGEEFGPPSNVVNFDPGEVPEIESVTPLEGVSGIDVQFSATVSGGNPATYAWDFGGGATPNTSSAASPTVTLGAEGTYNASLTVSNLAGSDTFYFTLTVQPAATLQVISVSPTSGEIGTDVTFTAVINGTATGWQWNFGPAANPPFSMEESPTVTLVNEGVFNMELIARNDGSGEEDSFMFQFTVTPSTAPPVIDDVMPQTGPSGADIQFSAAVSGSAPDTYAWDFGGGASPNTSSEATPTVTLGAEGTFPASLMVTNANGSDTFNFDLVVTAPMLPPNVTNIDPDNGQSGTTVQFVAELDLVNGGPGETWFWNFDSDGDGSSVAVGMETSNEESPTVTLAGMGIYGVSVLVTNAAGEQLFEDFVFTFDGP